MKTVYCVIALVIIAGCKSTPPAPPATTTAPAPNPLTPCNPQPGPAAPIVCIDYMLFDQPAYQPDPDPVTASKGAAIQFFFFNVPTGTNAELAIQFTPDTPVRSVMCPTDVHCTAQVRPNAVHTERKYAIIDRVSGRFKDPEVIIEP